MNEERPAWNVVLAAALLLTTGTLGAQQADRRVLDAEYRLAENMCRAAADSGSLATALSGLSRVAFQDPNYPGLKELQASCNEEYKRQRNLEDLLFEEAKTAYQRKAMEEARNKFQTLANRRTPHAAEAKRYLSLIASSGPAASSPASEQDYASFELATRHFKAKNYDRAKPLFEMLLNKGGSLAAESRKYLDQIEMRGKSATMLQQGMQAFRQRRYQDALDIFQKIEQQDPGYPTVDSWIAQARTALGKPGEPGPPSRPAAQPSADAAGLETAKSLFQSQDYPAALQAFRKLEVSRPDSPEIHDWVQKTLAAMQATDKRNRRNQMVRDAQAQLRRKEYGKARIQLQRALALSPQDQEISRLLAAAEAGLKSEPPQAAAPDRSAELATFLDDGVREFYAGNYEATDRLLEQYLGEKGKNAALAFFFMGAVASTGYFLSGEQDKQKETRALELFAKGRQANPNFQPPRDWVSPKIMALYDRASAKP